MKCGQMFVVSIKVPVPTYVRAIVHARCYAANHTKSTRKMRGHSEANSSSKSLGRSKVQCKPIMPSARTLAMARAMSRAGVA